MDAVTPASSPAIRRLNWTDWLPLLLILTVSLSLRIYSVASAPEKEWYGAGGFGDTHLYHRIAFHLVTGRGFSGVKDNHAYGMPGPEPTCDPAVTRGPTYPFFLAFIYGSAELPRQLSDWAATWHKVRLAQAYLDGMVCVLIFLMVRDLEPRSHKPALWASAMYALNPYSIYYSRMLLAESVTIFLMSLSLFFIVRSLHSRHVIAWSAAGGLGLALVTMARPEYLLFGGLVALVLYHCAESPVKLRAGGSLLLAFALGLLPWTLRTSMIRHRFAPTPTGGLGYLLFLGTFETNTNWEGWDTYPADLALSEKQRSQLQEQTKLWNEALQQGLEQSTIYDRFFMDLALDQLHKRPLDAFKCWIVRTPRLWYQQQIQMYPQAEPAGSLMLVYLTLAGLGVWHYRLRNTLPLSCLPVFLTLVFLPLHIESRYSVAALPAVISLAGLGLGKALEKRNAEKSPPENLQAAPATKKCDARKRKAPGPKG